MPSPKPQPAVLKLLKGDRPGRDSGGRKVNQPPAFVRKAPGPPSWLPAEAKAMWKRQVPELERLGYLKNGDREGLTALVLAWWRLREGQKLLSEEGLLAQNSQGRVRHPAVAIVEAASKELRTWCAEFGLTPSSEGKLFTPEAVTGAETDFD